eukprot:GHVU01196391.1.p2 GENE.GHVU01196391.1~~GHVU01196391.1.p2  ORF type:complete len:127 (+),score=8.56 GHVU01196391.1:1812-2192(+)
MVESDGMAFMSTILSAQGSGGGQPVDGTLVTGWCFTSPKVRDTQRQRRKKRRSFCSSATGESSERLARQTPFSVGSLDTVHCNVDLSLLLLPRWGDHVGKADVALHRNDKVVFSSLRETVACEAYP